MSGGLRTSVKGYLNSKRLALSGEIDTVAENESYETINRNFTALQEAADVVPTLQTEGEILLKKFHFDDLKTATWNFHPHNKIGEGAFGGVFKGWIDDNSKITATPGTGTLIAVKRVNDKSAQGHTEWLTEIYYLGRLCHPNLVTLLGYCFEDNRRLLVYEFMAHGSLDDHLFGKASKHQPLSWIRRIKIALGAGKALAFLHSGEAKVIHRDFKSSNILLDSNYNAKISDFGFAKDRPAGDSHVTTRVMGTYGYAAPEYIATGNLTRKHDVYGFGAVMLELLTGRRVLDERRSIAKRNLVQWAKPYLANKRKVLKIFDGRIKGQYSVDGALKAAKLAEQCLSVDPKLRPDMSDVVQALEQIQESGNSKGSGMYGSEPHQTPPAYSGSAKLSNRWRKLQSIYFRKL